MSTHPNRRRRGLAVMAGAVMAVVPGIAWAHAEFESKPSVPVNSDQKLTINVPEEKGPSVHNAKVVFVVPAGFAVSGCDEKQEWSCAVSEASGGRTLVTYNRSAGTNPDGLFTFGVHTPGKAGDYAFQTNQTYSDSSQARWTGPPESDNPAPVLKVT